MDKKDIYEHLAKIYLDASSDKKKRRVFFSAFKNTPFVNILLVVGVVGLLFAAFRNKTFSSETALVLLSSAAKINFDFQPAKKEIYSFNLNKLNLKRFNVLGFSLKKADYKNNVTLKVEFINNFKERAEVYLWDVPYKWEDYKLKLSDFKGISDWSKVEKLAFAVEEWNAKEKKGVIYLDNIRFLK